MKIPIGPEHQARQKRALHTAKEERVAQRLQDIKDRTRPEWGDLFRQQRIEMRQFDNRQRAALPRLVHHLKNRSPNQNLLTGALKALIGTQHDRQALEARHEEQRKSLSRQIRQQRQKTIAQEDKTYERDLAGLEKTQQRDIAAFEKAMESGQAKTPDIGKAPEKGQQQTPKLDFNQRVRKRIEDAKKRQDEERKRGKGKGRERDFD